SISTTDTGSSLVAGREVPSQLVMPATGSGARPFPTAFLVFWMWVATTLFAGYLASVFWGLVTGVYLIVRHSADGIAMSEVWLESDDENADSVEIEGAADGDAQENGDPGEG
ncbi:MAG: hypothetical protein VB859_06165, partial [Planctomycetaceae bacterium]